MQCWEMVVTNRFIDMREEWWLGIWKTGLWTVGSGNTNPYKVENDCFLLLSVEYMTTEAHWLPWQVQFSGNRDLPQPLPCLQVIGINKLLGRNIPHINLRSDFISCKKRRNEKDNSHNVQNDNEIFKICKNLLNLVLKFCSHFLLGYSVFMATLFIIIKHSKQPI